MERRAGPGLLSLALLLGAAACSSPVQQPGKAAAAVEIRGFEFRPALLEVTRGTVVTFANRDDVLHTATAGVAVKKDDLGTYDRKPTGAFDLRLEGSGTSTAFTFTEPGEFTYFCDRHAHMTAKVVVR